MGKFDHLFSPLTVGGFTYKNRIESAPMAFALIACNREAADKSFRKLEAPARGGYACVAVGELDVNFRDAIRIPLPEVDFTQTDGCVVEKVGEYAKRIKRHGAIAICELMHAGAEKTPFGPDQEAIGPNNEIRPNGTRVRAMTIEDMKRITRDFITCSKFVKNCGYDGVLIHGGHGFLFTQFLSTTYNKRGDEYGGGLENRARFPMMILKAIRESMGQDFLLELRVSAADGYGGITPHETGKFVAMLDGIIDSVQISSGIYYDAVVTKQFSSMYIEHGYNAELSAIVKKYTNLPVGVVGGINSPEQMEEIIAEGKADYVVLGRQSLADPEIANKAREGKEDIIRRCIRCFKCFPGSPEEGYKDLPFDSMELAKIVGYCTINPLANLPFDPYELKPPEVLKKVLIIGGGPAGMQAAITASDRGHKVVLAEKEDRLGGLLFFTDQEQDKIDLMNFKNVLIREVKNRAIEVLLNKKADVNLINLIKPDHIIIATGSEPVTPEIPGIEHAHQSLEVYRGNISCGRKVIMIGGGLIGSEQGLHLAKSGHDITIVEMLPRIADESYGMYREALVLEIAKEDIHVMENTKCLEIGRNYVKVLLPDRGEKCLDADTILYALGMKSSLFDDIKIAAGDIPVDVIGDAIKPGKVDQAISSAYYAAVNIGKV
ncbi:MAG: FAD-dependent oxidoreductase [Deltaproteobacteria bacterium]|nr:FAD-dependent oxidoreductase [Deltaproteobacteria bacterium]